MMIDKTKLGIELFDETFGGVYRGRTTFCFGRHKSGKSIISAHFLHQAFLDGDRGLLLTDWQAKDAMIVAESAGIPFSHMVHTGNLTIFEYASLFSGGVIGENTQLPPTAFIELQKIIMARSIRRVVFDTALPWLAIHPVERMPKHVFSFIHALDRLNVTVLIVLPWPVSTPAFMLKNRLEDICPVVFVAQRSEQTGESYFTVSKYLGEHLSSGREIVFRMGRGRQVVQEVDVEASRQLGDLRAPHIETPQPLTEKPDPKHSISFGDIMELGFESELKHRPASSQQVVRDEEAIPQKNEKIDFSSVIDF